VYSHLGSGAAGSPICYWRRSSSRAAIARRSAATRVERTLAWIGHNRRLARDFERYARSAAAFIRLAMIRIMLRRLTRPDHCS
jgi:transposase